MAAKRQRLQELIGLGGVSDAALTEILEHIRRQPVEARIFRKDCSKTARGSIQDLLQSIDLPLKSGGVFSWQFLNPQRLLRKCVDQNSELAAAFKDALRKHPNNFETPWSLTLYFDELTPGNVLRPDNRRKLMAVYMSFRELGCHCLCKAEFWFTIACVRVSLIQEVVGQWSHMLRLLLRETFLGQQSFETAGVLLYVDAPHLFFARLANVIADEAALKQGLDCKSASGLRPCVQCKNVLLRNSDIANRDQTGYLIELTCSDASRFDLASDQDLFDATDLLSRSVDTMGKTAFKDLEKSSGLNHNPHGVLADEELRPHSRPASSLTFDPMHSIYSNGIAAVEVHLFLQRMKNKTRLGWRDLQAFCRSDWNFPAFCKAKGRVIHEVFNESRERSSTETFKCGAAELLTLFPLLLHFGELFLAGRLTEEMHCLRALAAVLHEAQEAKFGRGDAARLATAIGHHFGLFKRTYGDEHCKPKHHHVSLASTSRERWILAGRFYFGAQTPTGEASSFEYR